VVVVAAASLVGLCRFLMEAVYRSARGWWTWFVWRVELVVMLSLPLSLPLTMESMVPLLLPSGEGEDMDVLEEDSPVLAVALDPVVLSSFLHSKVFGAEPGSLHFRYSPMCGSNEPIDASEPDLQ